MSYKRQPRFRVGDMIEKSDSMRVVGKKHRPRGVVVRVLGLPSDVPKQVNYLYCVKFFDIGQDLLPLDDVSASRFRICEKTEDKCSSCELSDICPHLPDIARCDISEFGQWRGEGKLDLDTCEQRNCEHYGVCLTNKWIPKEQAEWIVQTLARLLRVL